MRSLIFVVLALSGCAPLLSATSSRALSQQAAADSQAQVNAMLAARARAAADAQASCGPIMREEVSLEAELALGRRLALPHAPHLYLDPAPSPGAPLPTTGRNAVSAHVALVGKTLARGSARPELPWTFGVLDQPEPTLLSAPGGYVFVSTGLLRKLDNEAQLAAVLAHEMAHVTSRVLVQRDRKARYEACAMQQEVRAMAAASGNPTLAAGMNASSPLAAQMMDATFQLLANDKDEELAADKAALELIAFAGYDAAEFEALLQKLEPWPRHPATAERVAKLKELRTGALKDFLHGTAKPDLKKPFAALAN